MSFSIGAKAAASDVPFKIAVNKVLGVLIWQFVAVNVRPIVLPSHLDLCIKSF